ncbi:hypothetical protein [Ramlibacter sp. PS4R-6]|uniref:hypothetical protein n=1 Tax=Ramlibacter sp. PS4R-6 TaxID=3133438 RepID=UPI0030ABCD3E
MLERSQQAFEAWRAADNEARAKEARLAQAWQGFFAHESPAPPEKLFLEVSRARTQANAKLAQAIARMGAQLKADHPR